MRLFICRTAVVALILTAGCQQPATENVSSATVSKASKLWPEISAADLRDEVRYIASDECEGRLTGSAGAARAAQYIADAFRDAGLQPVSQTEGFFQPFDFAAGVSMVGGKNRMLILEQIATAERGAGPSCELDKDFRPLAFSSNGATEGEVVFVGYGLVEPQTAGKGYDSYAYVDVKGKVVIALRYLPEGAAPERRQELSMYAAERYKAKLAAEHGAIGFMLVTGPNSLNAGELVKLRPDDREAAGPIPAVSISGELASRLLSIAGLDLKELQTAHDGEPVNPHAASTLAGVRVRIEVELERVRRTCRNVLAVVPPTSGIEEYVVMGAHYDHLGDGVGLGSLAHKDEAGQIHNGADDNASGVSLLLEVAAAAAAERRSADPALPRRGIVFACWSGEELGLIGSSRFVNQPPIPLERMVAYFNFDMVGRLRDNKLIVQAVGSSPAWRELVDRRNTAAGFELVFQEDPYLPSDGTAFYTKGVPALGFFTGSHGDYHRPTDDADTLNYDGLRRIVVFVKDLLDDTTDPGLSIPYARAQQAAPTGMRGGARAYTGTVPDFSGADVAGTRIADVRAGGPADKAGLRGGDIIVEFAGRKISNLQDYSDALIGVKIGQPVEIILERGGERQTFTITPTARPE